MRRRTGSANTWDGRPPPAATTAASDPRGRASPGPRIVFRSTAVGAGYGLVAAVPLDDPAGPRALTDQACDRVYADRASDLSCLRTQRGIVTTFEADLFDARGQRSRTPGRCPASRAAPASRRTRTWSPAPRSSPACLRAPSGSPPQTVIRGTDGRDFGNLEDFTTVDRRHETHRRRPQLLGRHLRRGRQRVLRHRGLRRAHLARARRPRAAHAHRHPRRTSNARRCRRTARASRSRRTCRAAPVSHWALAVLDLATGEETVLDRETQRRRPGRVARRHDTCSTDCPGRMRQETPTCGPVRLTAADAPRVFIEHAWSPSVVRG